MPRRPTPVTDRLAARLVQDENGCFVWTGATRNGYGVIRVGGRNRSTHRVAWELRYGTIPEGLEPDHRCRNRACANVDHLELVTHAENLRRGRAAKPRKKRRLPKTLSREEAVAIMRAFNVNCPTGLRDRCMFELMYRGGLRVGEVCALMPRDVSLTAGTIRIDDGKGGDGTAYFDVESVGQLLERWRAERRRLKVGAGAPLFTTLQGAPVGPRHLQQKIKRMAKRAGVDPTKVTPHVFRHTFATELLDEQFHIREVQEAVRHKDLSTTMIYTHVLDSTLRDKIQRRGAIPAESRAGRTAASGR